MGVFVGPRLFQDAPLLLSECVVVCTYGSTNNDTPPPPNKGICFLRIQRGHRRKYRGSKTKDREVSWSYTGLFTMHSEWHGCLVEQTLISSFSWLIWCNWEEVTKTTTMLKEKAKKKNDCGFIDWSQQEDSMGCPFWCKTFFRLMDEGSATRWGCGRAGRVHWPWQIAGVELTCFLCTLMMWVSSQSKW